LICWGSDREIRLVHPEPSCCFARVLPITNISTYRFTPLSNLKELREELATSCKAWNLKGTILLSTEGINLFVAGTADAIERLLTRLREIPGLENLEPKVSHSESQPFNRMLVRIKKEIIAFGIETVRPASYTSPKIAPRELKQWLDEGRPVTLLDTRNNYEVKLGTFRNAIIPEINTFRDFPQAVRNLPENLKNEPVVMFCTGGIRCEKAGPFMEMEGYSQIYQLDGGILKYFEECGGAHYDGECFVFDRRVGLDPGLRETESVVCHACQTPLDANDREDPRYTEGRSCPYCHRDETELLADRIEHLQRRIREVTDPLPGSLPHENLRPINIPAELSGTPLVDALEAIFPQIPRDEWQARCDAGRFSNASSDRINADHPVRGGERIFQRFPEAIEPPVNAAIKVIYDDSAMLVIDKPAPLPMHPCGRYNRNTLQHILKLAWAPATPRAVHRLDANTSGLVLFGRSRRLSAMLQRQFIEGTVQKRYLVGIANHPPEDRFVCEMPISSTPGNMGTREIDESEDGLSCRTEFEVISRDAMGALLIANPVTGRTNQIRIHLWQLGYPVIGDPAYLPEHRIGTTQTLDLEAPPLQLLSWRIAFNHPLTGQRMEFEAERPAWAKR
jgi:UPF0176 protein